MFEEQNIREESIQLLKDQNNKLKIQNKELQLKDDQIKFLKETILVLEQEKDSSAHQNHTLKQKLKTMANQINNYNTNVVQKIYQENQNLSSNLVEQAQKIDKYMNENSELVFKVKEMQKQLTIKKKEYNQSNKSLQELKDWKSKAEKKLTLLQKENKQTQTKNIGLQRQVDDGNNQITYFSQQIDILSQKHQQTVKGAEKKLKQTVQKMINKEQLTKAQNQLKESLINSKQLKTEIEKMQRQNDKMKIQIMSLKQKLLNFEIKEQTQSLQLKLDLNNLCESVKVGKKVSEFQSQQHQKVSQIYTSWKDLNDKIQKYQQFQFSQQKKLKTAQSQLKVALEQIKMFEQELSIQSQRHQQQIECLQASFENTVMQLNLKLKKLQIALSNFKLQQEQLQKIKDQHQKQIQNKTKEKQAILSTMQQLKKENAKISQELSMAVRLCEENIMNRECISNYKYTLQELLAIVYYLHMFLLNYKQKIANNYFPFIKYYYKGFKLGQEKRKQNKKGINRFRVCVWAVRCIVRMRAEGEFKSKRGLERHAVNAVQRRFKIQNLSAHIENISKCILKGGKVQDILKLSSDIYKWKKQSFQRIILSLQQ